MKFKATIQQLAWYIERDGATVRCAADGCQTVTSTSTGLSWTVPADMIDELNSERDSVYRVLADRRRAAAAR